MLTSSPLCVCPCVRHAQSGEDAEGGCHQWTVTHPPALEEDPHRGRRSLQVQLRSHPRSP